MSSCFIDFSMSKFIYVCALIIDLMWRVLRYHLYSLWLIIYFLINISFILISFAFYHACQIIIWWCKQHRSEIKNKPPTRLKLSSLLLEVWLSMAAALPIRPTDWSHLNLVLGYPFLKKGLWIVPLVNGLEENSNG